MIDAAQLKLWGMRALFVLLCLTIIFFHLMPLDTVARQWAGPDLLVCLIFAWCNRRPEYVPILLIAAIMLLADMVFHRPPGLWAALVLISAEWLKSRDRRQRETTFALEWLAFAGTLIAITVLYRLVLLVLVYPTGAIYLSAMQAAMSIAAYPLVVGFGYFVLGVRRSSPADVDRAGRTA